MKKDILLVILALISVGLLVVVVGVWDKANRISKSLDEERYSRLVAEENVQKKEAKLATLEAQLKTANQKMLKVQALIDQEKSVNSDLQKQYEELTKTKADLEEKLKTTVEEKTTPSEEKPLGVVSTNSTTTTVQ